MAEALSRALSHAGRRVIFRNSPATGNTAASIGPPPSPAPFNSPMLLDEMHKDAQLLDLLLAIRLSVKTLAKRIDDTAMQTGAEAYAAARTVYTVTKTPFAKAAMRQASDDLAKHYGRKKKAAADTPTQSPATPATPMPAPTTHS